MLFHTSTTTGYLGNVNNFCSKQPLVVRWSKVDIAAVDIKFWKKLDSIFFSFLLNTFIAYFQSSQQFAGIEETFLFVLWIILLSFYGLDCITSFYGYWMVLSY